MPHRFVFVCCPTHKRTPGPLRRYLVCSGLCLIFWGLQKIGKLLGPEEDDFRVWQRARYSMAEAKKGPDEVAIA